MLIVMDKFKPGADPGPGDPGHRPGLQVSECTMRTVELGKKIPLGKAYTQLAEARNKGSSANCNLCPGSTQSLGPLLLPLSPKAFVVVKF